ncbi:MAG: hypothetical protein GY820_39715 [Gammaproteobacteria bacterium]|nr:hypothetical protein [Gammaproteobacteria bacterium]
MTKTEQDAKAHRISEAKMRIAKVMSGEMFPPPATQTTMGALDGFRRERIAEYRRNKQMI